MLRIQKRTALPVWKSWLIRAIAIIIALVLNGVLIYGLTKMNPVKVYATMFNGVFGTERRIWNTIRDISMLLCIGIGLAPAFKMKFWNIGAEGQILLGGIAAAACMMYFDSLPNGLLLVVMFLAAAAAGGFIFSFLTTTLRTNQNVTGLTLSIFGAGIANFFGGSLNKLAGGVGQISVERTSRLFRAEVFGWLPLPETLKQMFFDYGFMVYAAIIIAILVQIFLKRTNRGLNLRSVGESPATADAAGINVTRYKYLATCIGGGITGLGGVYYVMDYIKGTWANDGTIENLGWLAVALVIFATWKPTRAIWGSYLFGIFFWAYLLIASGLTRRSQELFRMLPYIVTIIVLIIVSLRRKKEDQPPAALGLSYFREER